LQQGTATRTSQASISAALAVAAANASARLPSTQNGSSLADIAQRDLDAALQLLADRAQYITGSSGAAIALRRSGKKDMLCRASAGSSAPELGALLSTEFGLSAESVRTRQVLRCDDVEQDARVNREACRQLGIASLAVMPVVNDDEVLGVFELFSGKANAFGERDLTALKRLSEMVETAVKLSRAAEQLPESLLEGASADMPAAETASREPASAEIENSVLEVEAEFVSDAVLPQQTPAIEAVEMQGAAEISVPEVSIPEVSIEKKIEPLPASSPAHSESAAPRLSPSDSASEQMVRPLLWSVALDPRSNGAPGQAERGQVPATLRNLRKCDACGFPVSPGRTLCVECEEKKWRGQLNSPRAGRVPVAAAAAAAGVVPSQETAKSTPAAARSSQVTNGSARKTVPEVPKVEASSPSETPPTGTRAQASAREPELVLTAAMNPSASWVSEHKFVIFALLAAGAAAAFLLR